MMKDSITSILASVAIVILILIGFNQERSLPRWVQVDCSECEGAGFVIYGNDHFFVVNKIVEPGKYDCPMCNGSGKLYRQNP